MKSYCIFTIGCVHVCIDVIGVIGGLGLFGDEVELSKAETVAFLIVVKCSNVNVAFEYI